MCIGRSSCFDAFLVSVVEKQIKEQCSYFYLDFLGWGREVHRHYFHCHVASTCNVKLFFKIRFIV